MYNNINLVMIIEYFYDSFRKHMLTLFETFTPRTKAQYQPCDGEETQEVYFQKM